MRVCMCVCNCNIYKQFFLQKNNEKVVHTRILKYLIDENVLK